jgi:cytoplasmic iron level regulating protein YaaA (DUF328/UPF0246 family)
MRIIISPAKKMKTDTDSLSHKDLPQFMEEAEILLRRLQEMSYSELKKLWCCNDSIAALNFQRIKNMDLYNNLTPAVLSFEGIQYQYMAPGVFETGHLDYIQEHLRILSGFYGLLRPFDGITPYRLEMQAKLRIRNCKNLYEFWADKLALQLCRETGLIVNLASKEYSKAVTPYLPDTVRILTCIFGELKGNKVIAKGTQCKMARGEMVRWLAENNIIDPEEIKGFNRLGYKYCANLSGRDSYVFINRRL